MNTLVILHLDGTQTEHEIDGDLELTVDPGDEIAVLDDNGAPAEAELKRDGENLELKLPDSSEVTLNNFYSGAGDSDPVTIGLSAQSTVEDYAEFEGLVGNLPDSGGFSLMRLSSTGYTDFTDSLGDFGREISALGAADNTPPSGNGFGAPGAGGGDAGGQGGSAASSQNQGGGNGGTTVRNFFNTSAAPAAAVDVNGDPISINRFHKLEEDGAATIFGTVPVVDPDGDRVFVTIGEGTQYGNFTVDGAGSYSYTPNYADPTIQELNVGDTLVDYATIRLNDDFGNESLSVVKFTISGTNDDPVAAPAFGTVAEPGSDVDVAFATGQVEGSDVDNGAVLGFSTTDTPSYGTIAMDAQGNWTYLVDPANNTVQALNVGDSLTETINYEVVDEHGATDTETLTITILGTNDAPVAQPETATIAEDSARVIGQLDATDIDTGASLAFTPASDQSGDQGLGNFTVNSDGIWLFDLDNGHPAVQALADGESIVETFTYEVTDEHGATDTETISVTVTGTNDDPVATGDSASIDENGTPITIPVLPNDSDVDGDTLTVTSIDDTALTGGTATQVGNDIVFDPGTDFDYLGEGETATETITYTVSDGNGGTDTATVTITVTGGNDGPTAVNDVGTVDEDATTNLDLLDNDTDPDTNDILTITAINGVTAAGVMTLPSGATVAINANGTVDYDPGDVFDYLDDTESATDSFEYTISDGNGGTDTATATITITGNEDPTVIAPDSAATDENTPVVIDVLGNDSDPDDNDNPLTVDTVTQPAPGQGTVTNNGTNVTFTPGSDFDDLGEGETEEVTFTYTTNTGATETVTVTVTGTNDGPVAVNDTGAVDEDATLTVNQVNGIIDDNDTDLDASDVLTVTDIRTGTEAGSGTAGILNAPLTGTYGSLTLQSDGSYTYVADQPAADALAVGIAATDTFTYTISDGNGGTDSAEIVITVTGTNDAPVAVDDTGSVNEDELLTVNTVTGIVDSNDTDLDGDTLIVTDARTDVGTYGTLVLAADGSYTYTADQPAANALAAGETATDIFSYFISDSNGGVDTANLTITITGSNDGPTAVDDTATTDEDAAALNIDLLGDDTDPDGDTLSLTEIDGVAAGGTITLASGALVTVNGDGTVDYDPNGQFNNLDDTESATDSFEYTISDGNGGTGTATATITITGNEDPTVIAPDSATTDENTPAVIDVLGNDSDPDDNDNPLTVDTVTQPPANQGTVTNNGTNVTFTPGSDFDDLGEGETEEVTFTYTTNTGATETVTVTVTGTNDGPVAVNDTGAVDEDATLTVNQVSGVIDDNDTDLDTSDILTVTDIRTGPEAASGTIGIVGNGLAGTYGTLTLADDGSYAYVADQPAADALAVGITATDTFTYTISDGNGGTDSAEIVITVTGTNDAPVAVDDTGAVNEGATLTVNTVTGIVDSNDTDLDGDTLIVTDARTDVGTYGTLVLAADGSYTYTADQPAANALAAGETATDIFSYFISDSNGGVDTANLTITITGSNDGPSAVDDAATTDEDAAALNIDLLGDDTDPDGDTLSLTEIDGVAAGGTITLASGALVTVNGDGTVDYDPNGQFNDLDDTESTTDSFEYTISDGNGGTDTATATITITGNEDPTVIAPDSAATDENSPVVVDVLANDSDPDDNDNPLTVDTVTQPAPGQGTVTNNGTNVTFVPGTDFDDLGEGETEEVTFTYTTNTGATETVTVTVTGTNDGPVAVNDTGAVDEDATLTVNQVSGVIDDNDTDLDTTDVLTVTDVRTGAEAGSGTPGLVGGDLTGTYGTLALADDGSYAYVADQPAADALAVGITATDTFTYTISDGNGGTDSAEITITVTGTNDAPVAVDDTGSVNEDATLTVNQVTGIVDSNDSDLDGDTLTVSDARTEVGTYGTLVLAADGSYSYAANTPAANALAAGETVTDTFSYTISDGNGGTDTADLVITVTGTNDGPTAVDDTATTDEDTKALNIDLLGDDTDPDGDTLSLIEIDGVAAGGTITLASGALVTVNGDGTVDYDPNGQFNNLDDTESATDSFEYTISDGNGGTDTATATITITGNEDPTVIAPDSATTDENTPAVIDVLGNDSDPDDNDNPLTVDTVTQPAPGQGTVTNNGTNVTFVPGSDFDDLGESETEEITFTYTTNTNATETVTVTVTGTNDGPVAVNDTGAVDEDDTLTVNAASGVVQDNDTDLDTSDVLTVTDVRTGTEAGSGTPGLVGGALTGTYGTLTLADDGSYTYVADQAAANSLADGDTATDAFTYAISDGNGGTDTAEILITVTGTNDDPIAVDDTSAVDEDATLVVPKAEGVIDNNDADLDGDTLEVSAIRTGTEAGAGTAGTVGTPLTGTYGTLTLAENGSYTYVADQAVTDSLAVGATATDTFTYTVSDGNGSTDTAEIVITVTGTNDDPVAVDDIGSVNADATLTVGAVNGVVQDNDTDPEGDTPLVVSDPRTEVGTYGTLVLAADGSYSYAADQAAAYGLAVGDTATDTFTYTLSDGNGGTDTAELVITINGTNNDPIAVDDTGSVNEDATLTVNAANGVVQSNDSDADGDTLTVTNPRTETGTHGTLVLAADGSYTYNANTAAAAALAAGETAADTFSYAIADGNGGTAFADLVITVTGTNDGPTAFDDAASTDQDTATVINVTGNDTDPDTSDDLTVQSVTQPALGSVSITGTGVRFDPGSDFDYLDDGESTDVTFDYIVSDGNGGTDTATVTVTVTGADDPLVADSDFGTTDEDTPVVVSVLTNDVDPDTNDNALAVTAVSNPALGSVSHDGTNVTFDPGSDFEFLADGESQDVTFTYTVTNQDGATDIENVTITVTGINDAPTTQEDTLHMTEEAGRAVDVIANDDDAESPQLTVTQINGSAVVPNVPFALASGATVSLMEDGRVYFNPNRVYDSLDFGETASETFTYTVTDAGGETATETVTVTIDGTDRVEQISGAYQVISNQLYDIQLDPTDESIIYVPIGDPLPFNFNSIAFNANDNLIYATAQAGDVGLGVTAKDIIQISPLTGQVVGNLGQLLNDQGEPVNNFAGVINSDISVYYVNGPTDSGGNSTYAIDLDPGSAGYLSVTGIGNLPGADYGVDPNTGLVWSVNGTTTYSLDPTSGVRTDYTGNGGLQSDGVTPVSGTFGSMFSDGTGNIQVTSNSGFGFYRVDTATGNLIRIADAPATNSNDATGTLDTALPSAQPFLFLDTDGNTNAPTTNDAIRAYDPTGAAVSIADTDTSIADLDGNVISSARIVLENPQPGDELVVVGVLPGIITGTVTTEGGLQVLTLSGDGSQLEYADAIEAVSFQNTGSGTVLADPREITVTITDENGIVSNPSNSVVFIGEGSGTAAARDTRTDVGSVADSMVVDEDDNDPTTGGATLNVLTNDSDNPTTIVGITQPTAGQGTVANNGDGTVTFNPGNDFQYLADGQTATTSFTYSTDTGSTETVVVVVQGAGDPIAAAADSAAADSNSTATIDVLANDSDPDTIDQPLSITALTQPSDGTVTTDGNHVFFDPGTDFSGLAVGATQVVTFIYTVSNAGGEIENETVTVTVTGVAAGPPVVIDLDGDGAEFVGIEDGILFDVDNDGVKEQSAWAGRDDGILVHDANDNNAVDDASEFVFGDENTTDLEALRSDYDSDGDDLLTANDAQFDRFKIWQDSNGDGISQEEELVSLTDAGIESIGLVSDGQSYAAANGDVQVHGESLVRFTDGTTTTAADSSFEYIELVEDENADADLEIVSNDGSTVNLDQPAPTTAGGNESAAESAAVDAPAPAPAAPVTPPPIATASPDDDAAAAAGAL